ncbi:Dabb family protein [Mangrovimicrobium sediminis]|uniref:Dabb family protein n=1 Tax=Mangrovimicrobium sediminis TaxID=2562682 RepID=A0A4Z0LXM5_9GAMM|nr:Dabb family protein [Haliea sp. SAOS-164]TGD72133.1 Dabb family protein [Haliea sp. SAOS-164]
MLRHIVLLKFKEDHTPEQVAAVVDGLNSLSEAIPQIVSYTHGSDAGNTNSPYDYAIVADFASAEDAAIYQDHPAHKAVGAHVVAIMADAAQMQFHY